MLDGLVITHDTIAEGVHFLPTDPPASVGWKLVAVNLSDLAGKGADAGRRAAVADHRPATGKWDEDFLGGVEAACESYGLPLVGGDTIALPRRRAAGARPDRDRPRRRARSATAAAAGPAIALWLVGTLGDAAAGLAQLQRRPQPTGPLVDIYRRPVPQLAAGQALAPHAHAMMDVSDGLLLDAARHGRGERVRRIRSNSTPCRCRARSSPSAGNRLRARLFAATGGDDYALLAALPAGARSVKHFLYQQRTTIARIGDLGRGARLAVARSAARPVPLPERLGFEHQGMNIAALPAPPMADRP